VEAAVLLMALVVIIAVSWWGIAVLSLQARCQDAAAVAARAVARGEPVPSVAGAGASEIRIQVRVEAGRVVASASATAPRPAVARLLPSLVLSAESVVRREPS
jgi:hypothetical protein